MKVMLIIMSLMITSSDMAMGVITPWNLRVWRAFGGRLCDLAMVIKVPGTVLEVPLLKVIEPLTTGADADSLPKLAVG